MADNKLVGQNYLTPDLVAKVTGKAKYAEDYRVEGMLFAKLLVSPYPHARVKRCDTTAAMAMPGVKAILRAEDMPGAAAGATLGEGVQSTPQAERGLTNDMTFGVTYQYVKGSDLPRTADINVASPVATTGCPSRLSARGIASTSATRRTSKF